MRRDHYVPQFILKSFPKRTYFGKVYFAKKGTTGIRLRGRQEYILPGPWRKDPCRKPPTVKEEGGDRNPSQ